jgi:integration host factor subunit alpha
MIFSKKVHFFREIHIMTTTKAHLIHSVYSFSGFQKQQSIPIVESIFEIMKCTLESGEDVLISGFGKLSVKKKDSRKGRNPQTGDNLQLDARRVVTFKCSASLKEKVNKKKGVKK